MNWKRLLILIAAFIFYLVIGGLVFSALESPEQELTRVDVRGYKEKLLNNLTCLDEDQLEALIAKVVEAVNSGLDPANNVTSKSSWDFSSAFFFSGTVVTTIGYGRRAPTTTAGQNFCIVYALVGIPFLGWLLTIIGDFYRDTFCKMTSKIDCLLCDYCAMKRRKLRRCVMCLVVASISYGILVLVPAAVFKYLEDWTFRIAHYYCFITLTTIGFGDYVASGDSQNENEVLDIVYDVAVVFWYIFGLSFFAVVLSTIGTGQQKAASKIQHLKKNHHEKTVEHVSGSSPYTVDKEFVEVTIEDGIVGPVTYHVHETSLDDVNNSEQARDPLESHLSSVDIQPEIAVSQEYSFNNSNGNAFNSQLNLVAADELQAVEPCGLSNSVQEKKVPLRKKVSFDSNCNPNDGTKRIRRKATGKRKSSSKSSSSKLKVNLEDEEDAVEAGKTTVAMATEKTSCYGNISPSTRNGQTFCIFYALIGIPIFGILMVAVGEKLKKNADRLEKKLNNRFVEHPKIKSAVYSMILLATGMLFFMIIPATIISRIEGWGFSDSFYYTFITLSTIGFGDFVIGTNPDIDYSVLYKWCAYCWIIIGLAFLTLVISFLSDVFTKTADKLEQSQAEKRMKRAGIEGGGGDNKGEDNGKVEEKDGDSEEMKDLQQGSSASSSA